MAEVNGTYGSGNTPCTVFTYPTGHGAWYCAEDSVNVNFTFDPIEDGVDIEMLEDVDCFSWKQAIESEDDLITAVEA